MQKKLLLGLAFTLSNFLLFQIHLYIFKSSIPFLAWLSAIIHIVLLIIFPYTKIFKNEKK